jgi:hypothetical protein
MVQGKVSSWAWPVRVMAGVWTIDDTATAEGWQAEILCGTIGTPPLTLSWVK